MTQLRVELSASYCCIRRSSPLRHAHKPPPLSFSLRLTDRGAHQSHRERTERKQKAIHPSRPLLPNQIGVMSRSQQVSAWQTRACVVCVCVSECEGRRSQSRNPNRVAMKISYSVSLWWCAARPVGGCLRLVQIAVTQSNDFKRLLEINVLTPTQVIRRAMSYGCSCRSRNLITQQLPCAVFRQDARLATKFQKLQEA